MPGPFGQKTTNLQGSFGKEKLICNALEGQHCSLGLIIISNENLFKLVLHDVLLIMNTYDVFIVALAFLEQMNKTLTSLMVSL